MRTRLFVAGIVVVLVLALAATGSARMSGESGRRVAPARALKITGGVRGLYPGARVRLPLKVRNLRGYPIRVVALNVKVGNASKGCRRRQLRISRLRRRPVVPAHRRRRIVLQATMLRSAPDACKGAVFPLRFKARGRRA
jgi:hypothetical protein